MNKKALCVFAITMFLVVFGAGQAFAKSSSDRGYNDDNYSRDRDRSEYRYGYDQRSDRIYRYDDSRDYYDRGGRNTNAAAYPDYRGNYYDRNYGGYYYSYENYDRYGYSYYPSYYSNYAGYTGSQYCRCVCDYPVTYGYNYNYNYNYGYNYSTAPGSTNYTRPNYGYGAYYGNDCGNYGTVNYGNYGCRCN